MPKLRNSIIDQIIDQLDYGDFYAEDFDIQFPDDSNVLAEITFKALSKYSFTLEETHANGSFGSLMEVTGQGNSNKVLRTIERPGVYKNHEQKTHDSIDVAIGRISSWVRNIRDDLVSSRATLRTTIDELTENFQKNIDETISDPETYFEQQEIDELKGKLVILQDRVSELESKFSLSPENTTKIQQAIDESKSNLKLYPKGVWYKTSGTKIIKVMKNVLNTKEGREVLVEMAKKLFIS